MYQTEFSDDPKEQGVTRVRAVHINELKDAINQWHDKYHLIKPVTASASKNDAVSATVFNDVIDGINSIYTNRSQDTATSCLTLNVSWSNINNVSTGDRIEIVPIEDIIKNLQIGQDNYCSNCDKGTAGYQYQTCVGCNNGCYSGYSAGSTCNNFVCPYCNCGGMCYQYCCGCHARGAGGAGNTTIVCGCAGCNACNAPYSYCASCYTSLHGGVGCSTCDNHCNAFACPACYSTYYRYPWGEGVSITNTYNGGTNGTIVEVLAPSVQYDVYETTGVEGSVGPVISAVPNAHYVFDQWDDGNYNPIREDVYGSSNTVYTAIQHPQKYTVEYRYLTSFSDLLYVYTPAISTGNITVDDVTYSYIKEEVEFLNNSSEVSSIPLTGMLFRGWKYNIGYEANTVPISSVITDPISGDWSTLINSSISGDVIVVPLYNRSLIDVEYTAGPNGVLVVNDSLTGIDGDTGDPVVSSIYIRDSYIYLNIDFGLNAYTISACPINPALYRFNAWSDAAPGITVNDPVSGICNVRIDTNVTTAIDVTATFIPL